MSRADKPCVGAGEQYLKSSFNAIFAVVSGPEDKAASGSDPLGKVAKLEAATFRDLLKQVLLSSMVSACQQQQRSSWAIQAMTEAQGAGTLGNLGGPKKDTPTCLLAQVQGWVLGPGAAAAVSFEPSISLVGRSCSAMH